MVISGSHQFLFIHTGLSEIREPSLEWDQRIALAMGWTNIEHRPLIGGYGGRNPDTGKLEKLPLFTQSVDAALSTKPDLWVLAVNGRFDGVHHVTLRPRGDLDKTPVETESTWLALAICHATMQAHHQMKREEMNDVRL